MSANRTERLLNLVIALLDTRHGRTREFLRENIPQYKGAPSADAFERTFERDKSELREMGIPIVSTGGDAFFEDDRAGMVYRIAKDAYSLPSVRFNTEEAAVLSLASRLWQQASLGAAAARAIRKLQSRGVVPETDSIVGLEPRIRTAEPVFADLFKAVTGHHPVSFEYAAASTGEQSRRRVQPWGIGEKYGHWYLVGFDMDRGEERTFRLSRITSAIVTDEALFEQPAGFDVARSLAGLDQLRSEEIAALEVRAGSAQSLRQRAATVEPAAPGWDRVQFTYSDTEVLAEDIASYGPRVRVCSPEPLRRSVVRRFQGVIASARLPLPVLEFPAGEPAAARAKTSSVDRLTRLLDLVPYLLANPGAELAGTARSFEITEDQLVKDLELLFVCGLPGHGPEDLIDASWEDGVIQLSNAEELSEPVRFTVEEACALIVGLEALAGVPMLSAGTALETARTKITAAAGDAANIGSAIKADIAPTDQLGPLEVMRAAIETSQRLRMRYVVPHRDELTERDIEPQRLYSVDDRWYVQAWCTGAAAQRNFRLDRVHSLEPTGERFDAGEHAVTGFASALFTPSEEDITVTVVLNRRAWWIAEQYNAERTTELADGTLAAQLRVATTSWLPQLAARTGGDLRVLEPADAAADCLGWAEQGLANYTDQ